MTNGFKHSTFLRLICLTLCMQGTAQAQDHQLPTELIVSQSTLLDSATRKKFLPIVLLAIEREKGRVFCTGSIIEQSAVLTAAHCLAENEDLGPLVGVNVFEEGRNSPVIAKSSKVTIHPNFRREIMNGIAGWQKIYFDIAVIGLDRKLKNRGILNISRAFPEDLKGEFYLFGFGRSDSSATSPRGELRMGQVERFKSEPAKNGTSHHYILIGKVQSCSGDSGGPVLRKIGNYWEIISITSSGVSCTVDSRSEAVFQHSRWIDQQLKILKEIEI